MTGRVEFQAFRDHLKVVMTTLPAVFPVEFRGFTPQM
jgi:hypothetical protein